MTTKPLILYYYAVKSGRCCHCGEKAARKKDFAHTVRIGESITEIEADLRKQGREWENIPVAHQACERGHRWKI